MARADQRAGKGKRGDIIEIKVLISYPMESGYRAGPDGGRIPPDIVREFPCSYKGEEIFCAELSPAIAANPFLSFYTSATESSTLTFRWTGNNGFAATETATITVE